MYVAPNSYRPISFYEDYLPNTVLKTAQDSIRHSQVTRDRLKQFKNNKNTYLDYQLSISEARNLKRNDVTSIFNGRVYADTLTHENDSVPLLFLKYSAVFPYSGLPYGNAWWKNAAGYLAGEPWGWHELDIHGAVHVILHAKTKEPLGVLLAQHNHHRTHLRSIDFKWPDDDRVKISNAVRSNEPYLISDDHSTRYEPTIGNPEDIAALYERTWVRPLSAGYDRIIAPEDGARKIPSKLELLTLDDPLYTSVMELGDQRKIFGFWSSWFREGPPGINYYTHPALKNLADLSAFWYIDRTDDQFFNLLEDTPRDLSQHTFGPALDHQKRSLLKAIKQVIMERK